jgi:choline dehydrogenase
LPAQHLQAAVDTFDFIIVGGGSAGCVLADRLSKSGKFTVLLLEAGGSDRRFMIRMPIGYGDSFYNPKINWMYSTGPQAALLGRTSYWPRGKVLGGSSSINAMIFARGQRHDFDDWQASGNPGWGWEDVLPHFEAIETFEGDESAERGKAGPLHVVDPSSLVHPLCETFLTAAEQAGYRRTPDYNGPTQEGVAVYQITTRSGVRDSSATAFLAPAMRRSNLAVITGAFATRVLVENGKAVGIEYIRSGQTKTVRARRECIVSAGAVNSPTLLQHSGIGPGALLQKFGVTVVNDLPAVGQNLQDHLGVDYLFRSLKSTLNGDLRSWLGRARLGLRYLAFRDGPLSLSVNQAGGFVRSSPDLDQVDMQLYFSPVSYSKPTPGTRRLTLPDPFPGFFIGISPCRPKSRGSVNIGSPDPFAPPVIAPNYLSEPEDLQGLLAGVRLIRRIAEAPAMHSLIAGEMKPGADVSSEEALIEDIRARAGSVFHASCTCRMGPRASDSAVDSRLRVHGMAGLRVVDASIFPNVTSGNTNAPTLMVAEKGAAMILEDNR